MYLVQKVEKVSEF